MLMRTLVEATIVVVNVRALAQRAYASDGWLTRNGRQTLSTTATATAAAGLPMTGELSEQVSERARPPYRASRRLHLCYVVPTCARVYKRARALSEC